MNNQNICTRVFNFVGRKVEEKNHYVNGVGCGDQDKREQTA